MCREQVTHVVSPTGRSRMSGMATQEEGGLPQTLSSALRDGDHFESIIRETGLNQDGRTTGITMPSTMAQVLRLEILTRPKSLARHSSHVKSCDTPCRVNKANNRAQRGNCWSHWCPFSHGVIYPKTCIPTSFYHNPGRSPPKPKAGPAPPSYHSVKQVLVYFFPRFIFYGPTERTVSTLLFFFRYLLRKKKTLPQLTIYW